MPYTRPRFPRSHPDARPDVKAVVAKPLLDVHGFLMHVAIESYVSELDGILGGWAMNNFYVYRPSASTQHAIIPWDRDNAFQAVDTSVMLRTNENSLMRRLLDLLAFARSRPGFVQNEVARLREQAPP